MNRFEGLMVAINNIISCLYKFSITIQNPAPSDRLERCSKIDVSNLEFFDIQRVRENYPGAETYLLERLGRANTKRRQLLKYHAKYHQKIAAHHTTVSAVWVPGHREIADPDPDTNISQTSFTASEARGPEFLRVPDPPGKEAAYKHSFQCPYCHQLITVTGESSWV